MSKRIATVDLGSNSFHMLICEISDSGEVNTIYKQKEKIQLRAGLSKDLTIDDETQARAIACLESFSREIRNYQVEYVEAVGTYTLRKARRNIRVFKKKLSKALGTKIRIISGKEEARLVYVGARQALDNVITTNKTLIVDIGGGSTEIVIGRGDSILASRSLDVGCVGVQNDFFSEGKLTFDNFFKAVEETKKLIEPIVKKYKSIGWDVALGSSGTIQSVIKINSTLNKQDTVNQLFLNDLITKMIAKEVVQNISFDGLREDRVNVIAGGVAILYAVFDSLGIVSMERSKGAVREGVLYEIVKKKFKKVS
ncbi:Ppx/GppA family phosphatase [Pseudofrancisella aestuarii]|uniref:Ppx/GppA family phosphatase n=1 Tax=Pseudofrancisella aestuarii TaxID=2670347 RepID=A0ABV9TBU3_9GAMM|nr:Ppx/GppA family phosphatase [Pseudofrancisella aestuarii]